MSNIEEIRKQTYTDMLNKLEHEPHMVAVPRPTGFGKTCMTINLMLNNKYKHILYVYPTEIIKNTVIDRYYSECESDTEELYQAMDNINGVTLMTYKRLSMLEDDDYEFNGYDLIIFDECHRLGAPCTLPKARLLREKNPQAHIIGLTATPNRSDRFDIIESYFKGITVFPYTLHDAFQDGLYKIPTYCYLPADEDNLEDRILEDAFMAGEDIDNLNVKKVIKKKVIEIASLCDISSNIKQTCEEILDTDYMKFICFFSSFDQLKIKSKKVEEWFRSAFPYHMIRKAEVTSRDAETKDICKLASLSNRSKTIDLIMCVDMLNMGYHVKDISGIVMYRATGSDIIYPQQYGRVLDSGSDTEHVIFDITDNLHRKLKFQMKRSSFGSKSNDKPKTTITIDGPEGKDIVPLGGDEYTGPGCDNIDIIPPETSTDGTESKSNDDKEGSKNDKWYRNTSNIEINDLKLAACTATYREQIAKLVAEPMQIRCKEAFEAHFRRWCIANGYKYPITNKELKSLYNTDKKVFIDYFENLIKENKLDYPMRDAAKLLEIGKSRPDGLPMEVFAKWKNVSIQSILELLEVA